MHLKVHRIFTNSGKNERFPIFLFLWRCAKLGLFSALVCDFWLIGVLEHSDRVTYVMLLRHWFS